MEILGEDSSQPQNIKALYNIYVWLPPPFCDSCE
jgi:hypothetical protein